ncbi:hypothetical protein IEZ26_06710 [Nocardioides cavernae]|uniref:Uncharacterized protein n=1 Tax=Nocardioides cavernae TaxID=1921566 RepID=A0ABR8N9N9_9ACTN|nr:hypothetical protein [Nocardioides cavernae]MBD3924307.1 hypothetical protein [Nocardioides cavernae]MBM7510751.1 hypothetical protein [Nocardioides cavernae]
MPVNLSPRSLQTALAALKMTSSDVDAWLYLVDTCQPEVIIEAAKAWAWEGIPGPDAIRWHQAGWLPAPSVPWWLKGFSPEQASFVSSRFKTLGLEAPQVQDWLYSPLLPDDIVLCAAVGVSSLRDAMEIVSRFDRDLSLRGCLTVQAAMNGTDVRALNGTRR